MYTLFADAGATKIDWGIITESNKIEFSTSGYNPTVSDPNYLRQVLISGFPRNIDPTSIYKIEYYGAGSGSGIGKMRIEKALKSYFVEVKNIKISTDLELAANALFDRSPGIACILGTGANAGFYSGIEIQKTAPSPGYLLGDEGSGMYLGKVFLAKIIRKELNTSIINDFYKKYTLTPELLISKVYSAKSPNSYLASFAPFFKNYISDEIIKETILTAFDLFYCNYIQPIINKSDVSIGFVGGIANNYSGLLEPVLHKYNYANIKFLDNPLKEVLLRM